MLAVYLHSIFLATILVSMTKGWQVNQSDVRVCDFSYVSARLPHMSIVHTFNDTTSIYKFRTHENFI